jgi:hypothetical protein
MVKFKSVPFARRQTVWRVTVPAAGNDEGDITLIETPSETAARTHYERLRLSTWPVRLEQVRCGPRQWRQALHRSACPSGDDAADLR